jgi:hypothetical protein
MVVLSFSPLSLCWLDDLLMTNYQNAFLFSLLGFHGCHFFVLNGVPMTFVACFLGLNDIDYGLNQTVVSHPLQLTVVVHSLEPTVLVESLRPTVMRFLVPHVLVESLVTL